MRSFTRSPALALAAAACLAVVSSGTGVARSAPGVTVYWTRADLLRAFFKTSTRVVDVRVPIGTERRTAIERRLGYRPARDEYVFYVGLTGTRIDGYALIDEEMGQHLPITFAVKVSPAGIADRLEIVIYREPIGAEVRDRRFTDQFAGKTSEAPLRCGVDLVAVTGATISSTATATGVKRALVLVDELARKGDAVATRLGVASR